MLVFTYLYVPEHRPSPEGRLDLTGLLLSGFGLSGVLYAISEGSALGWGSPDVIVAGTVGTACSGSSPGGPCASPTRSCGCGCCATRCCARPTSSSR